MAGNLPFDVRSFEYLTDAVIIVNDEQRIIYLNKIASDLYNELPEEAIGRKLNDLYIEEWSNPKENDIQISAMAKKGSWTGEVYHVSKRSGKFLVSSTITDIFDPSGKKIANIHITRKLNHDKKIDEQSESASTQIDLDKQELANIIDAQALQSMMDNIYAVTKIGFAVIDLNGNVLAANGWQDICTKFHRVNPQSLWNCLESDLVLTQGVAPGEFRAYKCKNNMWDFVTPIMVGKRHVGNLFSGQFFFDDEVIDKELFARQAETYGFDKEAYLAALDGVPRWNRSTVQSLMQFYVKLAEMISKLSYGNLRLSKSISDQKLIEQELREIQHDLKHAQGVAKAGSWRINVQTNQLLWSDETYRMFGIPIGTPLTYEKFLEIIYPEDKESVDNAWKAALRGERYDIEHRALVDDKVIWVREKAELEFDKDGTLVGGFGTVQDITQHKTDEEKLQKLNRTLRAISNSNQTLMRATDEAAFLQQGCRIIVEDCGYALVWIGFAQDDAEQTVKPMAYAGFDQGYIDSLNISWSDTERGRGPTGMAIKTRKVQLCNDMRCDPKFAPWRKAALARGYASSIVLPFVLDERAFGAINIYSKESDAFSEEEITLLTELTSDLTHGIMLLRMRAANEQAQKALQVSSEELARSHQRINEILCSIQDDLFTLDQNWNFVYASRQFTSKLGKEPSDIIGSNFWAFFEKYDGSDIEENLRAAMEKRETRRFEIRGKYTNAWYRIAVFPSAEGITVLATDITQQKESEVVLRKAREEWERTFDALPDYIAIIDHKHRILRVNKTMAQKLGTTPEHCFGLHCYGCVHETDEAPGECPHTKSMEDGQVHMAKLFEERLGGDLIVTTTPLYDDKGKIFATVHVARQVQSSPK